MLEIIGALENQAEQLWTSHQVTSLNEMQSVAGDALGNQRIGLIDEATAELPRHQMQCHEHLQGYQRDVRRHLSEVRHQVQAQQVARKENVENLRHEVSQSLAERSRYQNLHRTHKSGASGSAFAVLTRACSLGCS